MAEALPFSQACENNRQPILEVLQQHLQAPGRLLEIGSGTGQHAAWIPGQLPHIEWQPSDLATNLPGIRGWLLQAGLANVTDPLELDVAGHWPEGPFEYLFTANTFHIMSAALVERCIAQAAARLTPGGLLLVYGPFFYRQGTNADSNLRFDAMLRQRDPLSGIRDYHWVEQQASNNGLIPIADHPMPANNRILVFQRADTTSG